jgi:hypothetical protein
VIHTRKSRSSLVKGERIAAMAILGRRWFEVLLANRKTGKSPTISRHFPALKRHELQGSLYSMSYRHQAIQIVNAAAAPDVFCFSCASCRIFRHL